jgi:hypothetical protein
MSKQANQITAALFEAAGFDNIGTTNLPRFYLNPPGKRPGNVIRVERRSTTGGWWLGLYTGGESLSWQGDLDPLAGSSLLMVVGIIARAHGFEFRDPVGPALSALVTGAQQAALAVAESVPA